MTSYRKAELDADEKQALRVRSYACYDQLPKELRDALRLCDYNLNSAQVFAYWRRHNDIPLTLKRIRRSVANYPHADYSRKD